MIHIVFSEADCPVLQKAIELDQDKTIDGSIALIRDDYAVGPLTDIYTEEGMTARKEWWREVLAGGDYDGLVDSGKVNDSQTISELIEKLQNDPEETVWIWAAQNNHDVCGYYWLMSQLKDYQGRIFILYLNNLPFFNEKGAIFYPERLGTIPPKEFLKAKKLARPVTPSEFEVDPDEWSKLCSLGKGVRILEGGKKLASFDEDFYDEDLKKMIGPDWQKGSRIITQYLNKAKHTTGDAYLLWRLKRLAADGAYEMQGELKNMKDFELKKAAGAE